MQLDYLLYVHYYWNVNFYFAVYSSCDCSSLKSHTGHGYFIAPYTFNQSAGAIFSADYPASSPYGTIIYLSCYSPKLLCIEPLKPFCIHSNIYWSNSIPLERATNFFRNRSQYSYWSHHYHRRWFQFLPAPGTSSFPPLFFLFTLNS